MSQQYDRYLFQHRQNVAKGFNWFRENLPHVFDGYDPARIADMADSICFNHDASKDMIDEYKPYDDYFYGNRKSGYVLNEFNKAWLLHIHRNPHHCPYRDWETDEIGRAHV